MENHDNKTWLSLGEEGSVPLFQMPSACGFSVKRARRDLALVAKYDGCNVVQQVTCC